MKSTKRVSHKLFFAVPFLVTAIMLFGAGICSWAGDDPAQSGIDPQKPSKIVLLTVPLVLSGDYDPLTESDIRALIEKHAESEASDLDVVLVKADDSRVKGIPMDGDLSRDEAKALADAYNAPLVLWGTYKFEQNLRTVQSGVVIQYILSVQGNARVGVYDRNADDVVVDQPMIQSNSERSRSMEGSGPFNTLKKKLIEQCVSDLTDNLLKSLQKSLQKARQK
ncbi:MAG: hypothetical protein RDV48_00055 [Candidatus Eremiobacteraeota bacterium]|nr:hypothetical protein [Candidatus Eremiobacteraeota bacterium]